MFLGTAADPSAERRAGSTGMCPVLTTDDVDAEN